MRKIFFVLLCFAASVFCATAYPFYHYRLTEMDTTHKNETLISNFDTLWAAYSGTPADSVKWDSVHTQHGTRSVRLAASAGSYNEIQLIQSFALSSYNFFRYNIYCDSIANLSAITFYFSQNSGYTKYFNRAVPCKTQYKNWQDGLIHTIGFKNNSSASWDSITRIKIRVTAIGGHSVAVTFDRLTALNSNLSKGSVLYNFDDGNDSVRAYGDSTMIANGIHATFYVSGGVTDTTTHLSNSKKRALQAEGHTIGSHGYNHRRFDTLSNALIVNELDSNIKYMTANGLYGHRLVANPNGGYSDSTIDVQKSYCDFARITDNSTKIQFSPFLMPYLVDIFYVLNTTTLASAKAFVDTTATIKGATIFLFHNLTAGTSPTTYQWNKDTFNLLCQYIKTNTATVDAKSMMEYYKINVDSMTLTAGDTTSYAAFDTLWFHGKHGKTIPIYSSSSGQRAVYKLTGNITADSCNFKDISVIGGNIVATHSINGGNNLGIIFVRKKWVNRFGLGFGLNF